MKKKSLNVVGPEVVQGWFESGNQKYEYLKVPADMKEQTLQEDIKAGAVMFKEVEKVLSEQESRITLIEAEKYIEGLTAVSYMIGCKKEQERKREEAEQARILKKNAEIEAQNSIFVEEKIEEDDAIVASIKKELKSIFPTVHFTDEEGDSENGNSENGNSEDCNSEDFDSDEDGVLWGDIDEEDCDDEFELDDEMELEDEIDEDSWYEHWRTAAIVHWNQLTHEYLGEDAFSVPFRRGEFAQEGIGRRRRNKPYWREQSFENMIIYKWTQSSDENQISELEMNALKILTNCKHIYVILIKDEYEEDDLFPFLSNDDEEESEFGENLTSKQEKEEKSEIDYGICSFLIEYTANHMKLFATPKQREAYYQLVFRCCIEQQGLKLASNFPTKAIVKDIKKITSMEQGFSTTVEKLVRYIQHISPNKKTISKEDFGKIGFFYIADKKENAQPVKEEKIIGMEDVKKKLENIIVMMKYEQLRKKRGLPLLGFHNVHLFEGAPGTAKTTMAKRLGKRMQEEKLLNGTRFISLTGAELKGKFVGHTAPKIHQLFQEHDIIFIDEAYSISASNHGELDSFSQEALAQLAVELESHANDKLIIFAGYGGKAVTEQNNKMKEFLDANPGIQSRINTTVEFHSYNAKEMVEIVHGIAENSGFMMDHEADQELECFFAGRTKDVNFGNGREARSFVESCGLKTAERVMRLPSAKQTNKELSTITAEDVRAAIISKKEEGDSFAEKPHSIGFTA